ncbi:hypothetical protein [Fibrobacter intestinalis]|uniref:hypothetical protein n=1 Tax=Fibrobacter intestinalis TaxID=28122 RepID=UPI0023F4D4B3|nr:hypothetical protein [Fibrobacter intestinalis]MDD7299058.1 hypothetical protein [Fibrobacter intestinalis]
MEKVVFASALALFIYACATTQNGRERTAELLSADFNSIAKIHCINRTPLSEETQTSFRVSVKQRGEDPLRVCYGISESEQCFDTYRNYTYTECRETTPPYKHCHDDRFDGNDVWKIYDTTSGDTLMLGNSIFIAITGEGCFAAIRR